MDFYCLDCHKDVLEHEAARRFDKYDLPYYIHADGCGNILSIYGEDPDRYNIAQDKIAEHDIEPKARASRSK